MIRHRSAANHRRYLKGFCRLPWGPSFSNERSTEIYNRFRTAVLIDSNQLQEYESFQLSALLHPAVPSPILRTTVTNNEHLSSPSHRIVVTNQNPPQDVQCTGTIQTQRIPYNETEYNIPGSYSGWQLNTVIPSDQLNDSEMNSSFPEFFDVSGGLYLNDDNNMEDENANLVLRERTKDEFIGWAQTVKQWIALLIDFGISGVLFQHILTLLKAPYHCVTVKRNIIKYSNFQSIMYIVCRKHMLICRQPETTPYQRINELLSIQCEICEKAGTAPDLTVFEYLPIRERLIQLYSNEDSFKIVTQYRKTRLAEKMTDNIGIYEDYFDGNLFRTLIDQLGGELETQFDLFLGISTDGFQAFENRKYDCWPIVAINLNLDPSIRFLLKNVLPLGYIKGPSEPERLDTFFIPLTEELNRINDADGIPILCGDGVDRKIRVHVLWITGDKAAKTKLAGYCGHNGRSPCETCTIHGYWSAQSKHYYYPSKIFVADSDGSQSSSGFTTMFQFGNLPKRTVQSIEHTWNEIAPGNAAINNSQKTSIIVRTGIKPRTALYNIPTIQPFASFPHDSMHHIMNVSKDLLEIWKGQNRHLGDFDDGERYDFVLNTASWKELDEELASYAHGTSAELFGPIPRSTSLWKSYTAKECRDFFLNYAVVLFTGRISDNYLQGIFYYSRIVEICCRPMLTEADITELQDYSIKFYRYFERFYFCFKEERVGLMKSTMHSFLHLHEYVRMHGPFTNYNQFWVERNIGNIKNKLNTTHLAAESMNEQTKLAESYKLLFQTHFSTRVNNASNLAVNKRRVVLGDNIIYLSVGCEEHLNDPVHVAYNTKALLSNYFINKGFSASVVQQFYQKERCTHIMQLKFLVTNLLNELEHGNGVHHYQHLERREATFMLLQNIMIPEVMKRQPFTTEESLNYLK